MEGVCHFSGWRSVPRLNPYHLKNDMAHETATWMTCKKTGIYQADCKKHDYPQTTLKRGDSFPACPPIAKPGGGRGHMVDWVLIQELEELPLDGGRR